MGETVLEINVVCGVVTPDVAPDVGPCDLLDIDDMS
jgi:hypothetical protein